MLKEKLLLGAAIISIGMANAQKTKTSNEDNIAAKQHEQIGIVEVSNSGYQPTKHPDAQWFATAGFGMFIHWSISSVGELDLSWPMMAGTQIGWSARKPTQDSIDRYVAAGNFFAGHRCEKDHSCITPNQYWELAASFNPASYNPEEWVKAAKAAGMTYVVLTTRHHDGFALWPSKFGNFNTKNYMAGRDLVKPFTEACRKYGLKVGLYYSGPDWHFNKDFQTFIYYGLYKNYQNIPIVDADLKPVNRQWTDAQKQAHYDSVAVYIKGQITELLTGYGKIDMIWFDGAPDIPKGNAAWSKCISMDELHRLQPGIVVSPRFFGYGDYKTFEQDKALPSARQNEWAELCTTIATSGWGYTKAPLKPVGKILESLILCRSRNTNYLLNFGPDKDGVFSQGMKDDLKLIANWMKINGQSVTDCQALAGGETASLPATAKGNHRFLFLFAGDKPESAHLTTTAAIKKAVLLSTGKSLAYTAGSHGVDIRIDGLPVSDMPAVIDLELQP
jgi:alpha-L-fucosidase